MELIVGDYCGDEKESLLGAKIKNVGWERRRQCGNTTMLGKFIAALSMTSPVGGELLNVYSTNLDRSKEIVRVSKDYVLYYIGSVTENRPALLEAGSSYIVRTPEGVNNTVAARPIGVEACRDDKSLAMIFDEVGFMEEEFLEKVLHPVLGMSSVVVTCTSTPIPLDSKFCGIAKSWKRHLDFEFLRIRF
jgi:hypothetical protein